MALSVCCATGVTIAVPAESYNEPLAQRSSVRNPSTSMTPHFNPTDEVSQASCNPIQNQSPELQSGMELQALLPVDASFCDIEQYEMSYTWLAQQ